MVAQKTEVCKPFVVICGSHYISSSRAHTNKNSNGYTHVSKIEQFTVTLGTVLFVSSLVTDGSDLPRTTAQDMTRVIMK